MSERMSGRWAWAEVDLSALTHNVGLIVDAVKPADVWAVVKANGYGHGATQVARAALEAGATALCVALVDEGIALRQAGVDAPILLLSEQPAELADDIVVNRLTATVCTNAGVDAIAQASSRAAVVSPVHLKVDSGMHRMGAQPGDTVAIAERVASHGSLVLHGVYTHLAVADEPSHPATSRQLEIFNEVRSALSTAGHRPSHVHMANSAAALSRADARGTAVRVGIAMYGLLPGDGLAHLCGDLRPVMSLHARVSAVRWVEAGEGVSYGLHAASNERRRVATIPIGYADGVPRRLWESAMRVRVGGASYPVCGTVTMDQLMVDCGGDESVQVGDEAVLFGAPTHQAVSADDWARACGTIGYEIVCGIGQRIERVYR